MVVLPIDALYSMWKLDQMVVHLACSINSTPSWVRHWNCGTNNRVALNWSFQSCHLRNCSFLPQWLTWLMSSGVLELSWLSRSSCPSLQSWVLYLPFQFFVLVYLSSWGLVFLAFTYHVLESSEVAWRLVPVDFWNSGLQISTFSLNRYYKLIIEIQKWRIFFFSWSSSCFNMSKKS